MNLLWVNAESISKEPLLPLLRFSILVETRFRVVEECRSREVARDNNLRGYKGAQEIKIG